MLYLCLQENIVQYHCCALSRLKIQNTSYYKSRLKTNHSSEKHTEKKIIIYLTIVYGYCTDII